MLALQNTIDPAEITYKVPNLFVHGRQREWSLPELFEHLASSYAGTLAVQCSHLPINQQDWIMERMENRSAPSGISRWSSNFIVTDDLLLSV